MAAHRPVRRGNRRESVMFIGLVPGQLRAAIPLRGSRIVGMFGVVVNYNTSSSLSSAALNGRPWAGQGVAGRSASDLRRVRYRPFMPLLSLIHISEPTRLL